MTSTNYRRRPAGIGTRCSLFFHVRCPRLPSLVWLSHAGEAMSLQSAWRWNLASAGAQSFWVLCRLSCELSRCLHCWLSRDYSTVPPQASSSQPAERDRPPSAYGCRGSATCPISPLYSARMRSLLRFDATPHRPETLASFATLIVIIAPRTAKQKRVTAIADADARENWEMMIAWRDHLVKHRTLEAAYLQIIRRSIKFPNVLMGQLTQAILRN